MVIFKCSEVVNKISDIIDQQVSFTTRLRFHSHLMMCANCRRYFEQYKTVKELAGKVTSDDLPEDFDHVMGFVMKEIDKKNV